MIKRLALLGLCLGIAQQTGAREYFLSPGSDVVGEATIIEARHEDTFVTLARRHNVGFEALRNANPDVDAWLPGEGTRIVIPTQHVLPRAERRGIVVNLPELRLYYFPEPDGDRVITYPISIGRMDWGTPLGKTTVIRKRLNPTWTPPESIRAEHAAMNDPLPAVVPPGPDNPLGKHALNLGIPGYLIHGTNKPSGVGMRVTHGCIRMFPEDIEALFDSVAPGTPVQIVNQPYKLGWTDEGLYLEAHLPLGEERSVDGWNATELTRLFVAATEERHAQVEWGPAEDVMQLARGVPQFVTIAGTVTELLPVEESDEAVQNVAEDVPADPSRSGVPAGVEAPAGTEARAPAEIVEVPAGAGARAPAEVEVSAEEISPAGREAPIG
jgi:L,D-transpeptidase ErfK/SrfK